jgi:hypothetical protein
MRDGALPSLHPAYVFKKQLLLRPASFSPHLQSGLLSAPCPFPPPSKERASERRGEHQSRVVLLPSSKQRSRQHKSARKYRFKGVSRERRGIMRGGGGGVGAAGRAWLWWPIHRARGCFIQRGWMNLIQRGWMHRPAVAPAVRNGGGILFSRPKKHQKKSMWLTAS